MPMVPIRREGMARPPNRLTLPWVKERKEYQVLSLFASRLPHRKHSSIFNFTAWTPQFALMDHVSKLNKAGYLSLIGA